VSPSAEKCEKCGYDFSEEELEDEDVELEGEEDQKGIEDHEELQGEEETGEELKESESQEEEEISEYDEKIPLDIGAQGEGGAVEELEGEDEDQVIEKFTKISGLGRSKAKALYDAGFTGYDSLRKAKASDIADVKGIGKNLAKTIKDQLKKKKFKDQ
jgi:predicted flap endonuclease-1-like 5' DNA nuclease